MGCLNKIQNEFISWFDKDNNASFLFVTAALGWVLASAAQTCGLLQNKELTKKDKKFLVPQEIMDGTANIAMYALVTTKLMSGAKKLVQPGKNGKPFINLKDASGNIFDYASNQAKYAKMGRNLETGAAILGGIISTCILTPFVRNAFAAYMKKKSENKPAEQKMTLQDNYSGRIQPFFTKTYSFPAFKSYSGNMKI